MSLEKIKLGLGLIGIGRSWGYVSSPVPDENTSLRFLEEAWNAGIDFFDTAPSYGFSEERLGKFLRSLSVMERESIYITTKFGEIWDFDAHQAIVDHSYDGMRKSIERSLEIIGKINMLQLHKTTNDILRSEELERVLLFAKDKGVNLFGASVSDVSVGRMICDDDRFSFIQIPFNMKNLKFEELIDLAYKNEKKLLINRPFGMGEFVQNCSKNLFECQVEAYEFILRKEFEGCILSGTKNIFHLRENINSFQIAKKNLQK